MNEQSFEMICIVMFVIVPVLQQDILSQKLICLAKKRTV